MIKRRGIILASKRQRDYEEREKINAQSALGEYDGFFTRDDCIEYIEIPLEEKIRADKTYSFSNDEPVNIRCYIEDTEDGGYELDVDIELDDCFFNIKLDRPIDMRKIRVASDLSKYIPELYEKFCKEYDKILDNGEDIAGCDDITAASEPNPEDWEFNAVPLKSLKKGAWFTIKPIAYPTDKQVYIKDDYDREEKKFMCGRCDDISYSTYFKGDKMVYDDNNFEY